MRPVAVYAQRLVVAPGHALAQCPRVVWQDLHGLPWVLPPAWASSRVKLAQQFYRRGLNPPADVIETASHLATFTWLQQRGAVAFVAHAVALQAQAQGQARVLALRVPMELPQVGLILLRGRMRSPACLQLLDCLQQTVPGKAG